MMFAFFRKNKKSIEVDDEDNGVDRTINNFHRERNNNDDCHNRLTSLLDDVLEEIQESQNKVVMPIKTKKQAGG